MITVALTRRSTVRQLCRNVNPKYGVDGGEKPGRWHLLPGSASRGVFGPVHPQDLRALTRGYSLRGRKRVRSVIRLQRGRRPFLGIHYIFEAPLTWSIWWAFAQPEIRTKMQAAFDFAVEWTVRNYIQPEIVCCRLPDGTRSTAAIGAAQFIRITRPDGAMHYCAHVLIPPLGECPDHEFRTLVAKPFFRRRRDAEAYFHLALEFQCKELGLQFHRPLDANGRSFPFPELKDVPNDTRDHFFPRPPCVAGRREVPQQVDPLATAAILTRNGKYFVPAWPTLFSAWKQEARDSGLTLDWTQKFYAEIPKIPSFKEYSRFVRQATSECTQGAGHFHRKDIFREAFIAAIGGGGVDPVQLHAALARDLEVSPNFVKLGIRNGIQRYTTPEIQELERELLWCAKKLHASRDAVQGSGEISRPVKQTLRELNAEFSNDEALPLCPRDRYYPHLDRLNKEQMLCANYATSGNERIKIIHGASDSTRICVAAAIAEAYQLAGCRTYAAAPSLANADEFTKQTGVLSATAKMCVVQFCSTTGQRGGHHIQQILRNTHDLKNGQVDRAELDPKSVLFVNNASAVGLRDLTLLTKACLSGGATMILLGDSQQRPVLERGSAFGSITDLIGGIKLKSSRQEQPTLVVSNAQDTSRAGREEALKVDVKLGRLHVARTATEAQDQLIQCWVKHGGDAPRHHLIVASSDEEIRHLNDMAQRARLDAGKLPKSPSITVNGETFYNGDRVALTEHRGDPLAESEAVGTIVGIRNKRLRSTIKIERDDATPTREVPVHSLLPTADVRLTRAYAVPFDRLKPDTTKSVYVSLLGAMTDRELTTVTVGKQQHAVQTFTDEEHAGITLTDLAREQAKAQQELAAKHDVKQEPAPPIGRGPKVAVTRNESQLAELTITLDPEN